MGDGNGQSEESKESVDKEANGDDKGSEQKSEDAEPQTADSSDSKEKESESADSKDVKSQWMEYADSAKLSGDLTLSVTSKLENGWKWTEHDTASAVSGSGPFLLNSWLTVPRNEYSLKVSSGESSKIKMNDGNLDSYWQSSSGLKHWIKMSFAERACVSGIGLYLNTTKDMSYFPDRLRVTIGVEDGDNSESLCILKHCVQRDFKGLYILELAQGSNDSKEREDEDVDEEEKALQDAVRGHPRGYAQCDWLKVDWINDDQNRYTRIRHLVVFSKQCDEMDQRLRSCLVQKRLLLEEAGLKCVDLLEHIPAEMELKKQRKEAASADEEKEQEDKGSADGKE